MPRLPPWVIPTLSTVIAVALPTVAVLTWRMTPGSPLRAELLWAASAVFALIAAGGTLRQWRRRGAVRPVSG